MNAHRRLTALGRDVVAPFLIGGRRRILAFLLLAGLVQPCHAASEVAPAGFASAEARRSTERMEVTVTNDVIRLGGGISRALPSALNAILDRHPQVRTVLLDSPGGEIFGSLSTAELIRRRRLNTMVPSNSNCASACVILLAAGVERRVAPATRVGVHAWRYARPVTDEDLKRDVAALRSVFNSLGVSAAIVDLMVATPHEAIRWLSHREMQDLRLITDEPGSR